MKKGIGNFLFWLLIIFIAVAAIFGSSGSSNTRHHGKSTYVKPSTTRSGQFRKGHFRKSYSTDKKAYKKQQQSKSYYQRKGKYIRKKKSN